jgi:hypothetical protein
MCSFFLSLGTNLALYAPLSFAGSLEISIFKIVSLTSCPRVDALSPLFLLLSLVNELVSFRSDRVDSGRVARMVENMHRGAAGAGRRSACASSKAVMAARSLEDVYVMAVLEL